MDLSQILHMYITSLVHIALKYNEHEKHENQYMLKILISKACKLNKELEIVTKIIESISRSPNHGGSPTKHP